MNRTEVTQWLDRLKRAWESKDVRNATALFEKTERYYERPFRAGTTQTEIAGYWRDIDKVDDIKFDYEICAIENRVACVRWENTFLDPSTSKRQRLDGVFVITFDDNMNCKEFRQWWFMET